jgi:CxxC motif-containing protein (DUF1111 family)
MGLALILSSMMIGGPAPGAEPSRAADAQLKLGEELFEHEWEPNDPRCHGGDGLGPMYNATSCVACHGDGGPGGGGPAGMNVQVISLIGGDITDVQGMSESELAKQHGAILGGAVTDNVPGVKVTGSVISGIVWRHVSPENALGIKNGFVVSANGTSLKARQFDVNTDRKTGGLVLSCAQGTLKAKTFLIRPDDDILRKIHPGLVATPSTVIHHFSVDSSYRQWRRHLVARIPVSHSALSQGFQVCGGTIYGSERNSPPLFGLGLIDALPDEVLVATAEQEPARVQGRVNRLTSGRIGRFGWKAQTADLREFVLAACANELGLEVPGNPQSVSPLAPESRAKAPDMTQEECDALVAYVKALPAPVQLKGRNQESIVAGRWAFEDIGCADCHRPSLGNIKGIYSDLLMHDMGPELVSVTMAPYYGNGPSRRTVELPSASSLADGTEWRTPPLWGYRNSGPYLHDGRARNLYEVVAAHKGQALSSAMGFAQLSPLQQAQVEMFLMSLAAPPAATTSATADAKKSAKTDRLQPGPPPSSPPARQLATPARADAKAASEPERRAASRLQMAQTLEKMGKPQGAVVFYREIIRDEPDTDAARTAAQRIKALGSEENAGKGP